MPHIPLIFIIAGEPSGDQLGADLMSSLKEIQDVRFAGIGGPAMAAQGLTSIFPMEELSIMGVVGILRHLPHLLGRLSDTAKIIQQMKPAVVVTIDAPEFSFRVLKRVHKLPERPRLIHYVAPTVWAWRPRRAQKISKIVDRLLCLYPFEPPYFEKHGLKTVFVGHPVAKETVYFEIYKNPSLVLPPLRGDATSSPTPSGVIPESAKRESGPQENAYNVRDISWVPVFPTSARMGMKPEGVGEEVRNPNLLCVLPGSRRSEINTLLPIFGETVKLLKEEIPDLRVVIPTLPSIESLIRQGTQDWPIDVQIVVGDEARQLAFQKASVALAASGTVALQLAAAGLPFVIAYKLGKINEWIGRALLKTPWACMVNILLAFHTLGPDFILNRQAKEKVKEPWIPEFLQEDCKPENLKEALIKLLRDQEAHYHQEQAMAEVIRLLKAAPHIAAQNVLEESRGKIK